VGPNARHWIFTQVHLVLEAHLTQRHT
jgi:hypothetical protein